MRKFFVPSAAVSGAGSGIGIGLLIIRGDLTAAIFAIAGGVLLGALITRFVAAEARTGVIAIVSLAYSGRLALLAILHEILVAAGRSGHLFGDDFTYERLSWQVVEYLHGAGNTIQWFGEAYLMGVYVYLETAVFSVFGEQVTIVKVLNVVFAGVVCLLTYAVAARLFGRRAGYAASALAGFFPSLVLWSVLNIKDSLALLLLMSVVWSVTRFATGDRSWRALVPVVVSFLLLESVRRYLFLILGVLAPLAILVAPQQTFRSRFSYVAASFAMWGAIWLAGTNGLLGPIYFNDPLVRESFIEAGLVPASAKLPDAVSLEALERQRGYSAVGARTAFTDPALSGQAPLVAKDGDSFVVQDATPGAPSCTPTTTRRVVHVTPGEHLVLSQTADNTSPAPDVVIVHSCDLIVVGEQNSPATIAKPLALKAGNDNTVEVIDAAAAEQQLSIIRRLTFYLPRGLFFAVFVPFPWSARTVADFLTVPEMLVWYPLVILAVIGALRSIRRWRVVFIAGGTVSAILVVLALTEGNAGTLFRHRAMAEPLAFVFAAPALVSALGLRRFRLRPVR